MKAEDESHASGQNGLSGGSPEIPCLKSCASSNPNNHNNNNNHHHHNKEQDRFLPIANVGRIMKKVIPLNGKISKDAKETVQECVSEFISFVTGEASDKCQREKRKTINGDDIIWAITTLGFEDYVSPLKVYLEKYREIEGDQKVNNPKQQRSTIDHHQQQQQQQRRHHQPHNNHDQLQEHNLPLINSVVYSTSPNYVSQPSFITADPAFSFPFSPNSIKKQLQPQDQIDSVAHW